MTPLVDHQIVTITFSWCTLSFGNCLGDEFLSNHGQSIFHRMSQFDGEMIQFCDESAMKCKLGHAAFFVIPTNLVLPTYPAS